MKGKIIFQVIMSLIFLAFAICAITWLMDLKKKDCTCADDANYKFLVFMCGYIMLMGVVGLFMSNQIESGTSSNLMKTAIVSVGVVNTTLVIVFVVIGLKYIKKLKERQCACALDDPRRKVFEAWLWTYVAIYALVILFLIISLITIALLMIRH